MTTCATPMRSGACALPDTHRGRCTTATFTCDFCGTVRRGSPAESGVMPGPEDDVFHACFPCVKGSERESARHEYTHPHRTYNRVST